MMKFVIERIHQPDAREGQTGPHRESERLVVPMKPGNAGRGKGPWFKAAQRVARVGTLVATPASPKQSSDATNGATTQREGCKSVCDGDRVLVREPDAGNPPVRFDEGDVETERLCYRATSLLYSAAF